jgi:hypothetical protein
MWQIIITHHLLGLAVAEKPPFWFEEKIPEDSV